MYTTHLGVYRRSLADELGGFRPSSTAPRTTTSCCGWPTGPTASRTSPRCCTTGGRTPVDGRRRAGQALRVRDPARTIAEHLRRRGSTPRSSTAPARRAPDRPSRRPRHRHLARGRPRRTPVGWRRPPARGYHSGIATGRRRLGDGRRLESAAIALRQRNGRRLGSYWWRPTPPRTRPRSAGRRAPGPIVESAVDADAVARPDPGLDEPAAGLLFPGPESAAAAPLVLTDDDRIAHAGVAFPNGLPVQLLHGLPGPAGPSLCTNVVAAESAVAISESLSNGSAGWIREWDPWRLPISVYAPPTRSGCGRWSCPMPACARPVPIGAPTTCPGCGARESLRGTARPRSVLQPQFPLRSRGP